MLLMLFLSRICIIDVIESNSVYKAIITKDMLCVGWDGKVVKKFMNALNDGE